jgi:hypothetical protein
VLTFEGIPLDCRTPLTDLPKYESNRVDVDFLVVPRMRHPQLGRLPVNRPDETPDHALHRRLDDPCESKVANLGDALSGDEDVGALDIAVNDSRDPRVKVVDPFGDAEHDLEHGEEGRVVNSTDVVEQVAVRAELGDDHDGDEGGFFRDGDADEVHDVGVAQVAQE